MPAFEPKPHLSQWVAWTKSLLVKDLKAIAEDAHNTSPGGCARPALNVVAECAVVNGRIAGTLRGEESSPSPSPEERAAFLASFDTEAKVIAFLEEETAKLLSAIDAVEEDTLGNVVDGPLGRPMTLFGLVGLAASHMMYHDGQLNYIQSLHGDGEIHWG